MMPLPGTSEQQQHSTPHSQTSPHQEQVEEQPPPQALMYTTATAQQAK